MLTDYEKQQAAIRTVKACLDERLAEARANNDALLTPEKTSYLRGRIAEIKRLISELTPEAEAPGTKMDGQ